MPTIELLPEASADDNLEKEEAPNPPKEDAKSTGKRALELLKNMNMITSHNTIRPRRNVHAWDGHPDNKFGKITPVYHFGDVENYRYDPSHQITVQTAKDAKLVKSKKCGVARIVFKAFDAYCDKSTLHGLRYVGDNTLSIPERLFWLISFLTALSFAIYFITSLYEKFNQNPVIVSFSPTMTTVDTIPFPAITICNVNVATKNSVEQIINYGSATDKRLLSAMCDSYDYNPNETVDHEDTADWTTVRDLILYINQRCDDMFKVCLWESKAISCEHYINSILTDEGYCCSFNRLPSNYSLRNPGDEDLNETYPIEKVDWNPENGYPTQASPYSYPLRSFGSGAHLGLTLVIDADLDQYYCSSTSSIGFKLLLSNPIETPKIADYGFLMSPGEEARITIRPNILEATPGIKGIAVSKRQCFFTNERYLQFYRLACNCLPGCFELNYEIQSVSKGKITKDINNTVSGNLRANVTHEYFARNIIVANFFFSTDKFTKQIKSELYGFSEFLSNTGGLLGLFLGFSFLSAVEIFYFVVLKTACNVYKKEKKKHANAKKMHFAKDASTLPYTQ